MAKNSHNSKEFDAMLQLAIDKGCRVTTNNVTVKVFPPINVSNQFYTAHRTSTAIHPLRRFLKNVCKFNV